MEMFVKYTDFLKDCLQTYTGGNKIWILYPVALLIILFLGKKEEKKFFGGMILMQIVTIFNPLVAYILIRYFGYSTRYLRLFWSLPFYLSIAIAVVKILEIIKKKSIVVVVLILITGSIMFLGNPVFVGKETYPYERAKNHNFVREDIPGLAEILHAEGIERPKVLYNSLIFFYRQYDPSVISLATRNMYSYVTDHTLQEFKDQTHYKGRLKAIMQAYYYGDYSVEPEYFRESLKVWEVDYVISEKEELNQYLESASCTLIGEHYGHYVWKVGTK